MFIENPKRETGSTPTESHLTGKLQGYKHFTPFGVIGEPINGQFRKELSQWNYSCPSGVEDNTES